MIHEPGVTCLVTGCMSVAGRKNIGRTFELIMSATKDRPAVYRGLKFVPEGNEKFWLVKRNVGDKVDIVMFREKHLLVLGDPCKDVGEEIYRPVLKLPHKKKVDDA